jgi:hypothetical protein
VSHVSQDELKIFAPVGAALNGSKLRLLPFCFIWPVAQGGLALTRRHNKR